MPGDARLHQHDVSEMDGAIHAAVRGLPAGCVSGSHRTNPHHRADSPERQIRLPDLRHLHQCQQRPQQRVSLRPALAWLCSHARAKSFHTLGVENTCESLGTSPECTVLPASCPAYQLLIALQFLGVHVGVFKACLRCALLSKFYLTLTCMPAQQCWRRAECTLGDRLVFCLVLESALMHVQVPLHLGDAHEPIHNYRL